MQAPGRPTAAQVAPEPNGPVGLRRQPGSQPHALLECAALEDVRLCHADLLEGRESMRELMATAYDPELVEQLAGFARDAMRRIQTATGNQVGPGRGRGRLAGQPHPVRPAVH